MQYWHKSNLAFGVNTTIVLKKLQQVHPTVLPQLSVKTSPTRCQYCRINLLYSLAQMYN